MANRFNCFVYRTTRKNKQEETIEGTCKTLWMEAEADWQRQGLTVHVDKADSVFLDLT